MDFDREKAFKLVTRLNEIRKEQNKLDIEYNEIVNKLWDMIPTLKGDPNLEKKKGKEYRREKNMERSYNGINEEELRGKTIAELQEMKMRLQDAYATQKDKYQEEMLCKVGEVLKIKSKQLTAIKKGE